MEGSHGVGVRELEGCGGDSEESNKSITNREKIKRQRNVQHVSPMMEEGQCSALT